VKLWKRKPSLMLVLVTALTALLPLLAVLQFRWLGEVSRAERDRMQASLSTAVANFTQEFDHALTTLYTTLQMDARTLHDHDWSSYARRYDHWMYAEVYPQLLGKIYLVEPGGPEGLQLSRFDRPISRFTSCAWPATLERLRGSLRQGVDATGSPAQLVFRPTAEVIDAEAMALVIPIPAATMMELPDPTPTFAGYVIVTLDAAFIRNWFIPALAARYFKSGDSLDYRFAIMRRDDPASVIYQTESGAAEKIAAAADATAGLFGVHLEAPTLVQGITREVEQSTISGGKKEHTAVRIFNYALKSGRAPSDASQGDDRLPGRIAIFNNEGSHWLLTLQHRAGSLDAAVATARRRNLAMSFGILLLLSVSIAMILVSTRRASALARQQMEFVAGVSHEMRTPLAVICSAGENLADGVIEEREQVRRYGSLIESEGRRLAEMVEQALEFAGIQSGRKAYALQPADADGVVESALAACAPLIEEGGFAVEKQFAADLPPIAADAAALSRAIQNLLNNAMKYSGESRSIHVAARATGQPANEVEITIQDRGLGIAAADLPHIFEPFYRSAAVASAQIHGSGLGLSLVKHIVEAHGGRVRVESTPSRGSVFTLSLPMLVQDSGPERNSTASAYPLSNSPGFANPES
jgi:signal transduction histidine kinase